MTTRFGRVLAATAVLIGLALSTGATGAAPAGASAGSAGSARPAGRPGAPTGGCRSVGGGPVSGGGPQRATVVIDPGSGPVVSVCISFSGSISGVRALDLAAASSPGVSPVYDLYSGEGRAVCKLLGVGNDPPGCLGKTADYWAYFRNGTYSRGGAGSATIHDGDVEGWRWGRGSVGPRRATTGTEAAPAEVRPAPPATDPAPAVPAPAAPRPGSGSPSGNSSGQPTNDPAASAPTSAPRTGAEASPGQTQGDSSATSLTSTSGTPGSDPNNGDVEDTGSVAGGQAASARSEAAGSAAGATASGSTAGTAATGAASGKSGASSLWWFAALLALVGVVGILLRRRRVQA